MGTITFMMGMTFVLFRKSKPEFVPSDKVAKIYDVGQEIGVRENVC